MNRIHHFDVFVRFLRPSNVLSGSRGREKVKRKRGKNLKSRRGRRTSRTAAQGDAGRDAEEIHQTSTRNGVSSVVSLSSRFSLRLAGGFLSFPHAEEAVAVGATANPTLMPFYWSRTHSAIMGRSNQSIHTQVSAVGYHSTLQRSHCGNQTPLQLHGVVYASSIAIVKLTLT